MSNKCGAEHCEHHFLFWVLNASLLWRQQAHYPCSYWHSKSFENNFEHVERLPPVRYSLLPFSTFHTAVYLTVVLHLSYFRLCDIPCLLSHAWFCRTGIFYWTNKACAYASDLFYEQHWLDLSSKKPTTNLSKTCHSRLVSYLFFPSAHSFSM